MPPLHRNYKPKAYYAHQRKGKALCGLNAANNAAIPRTATQPTFTISDMNFSIEKANREQPKRYHGAVDYGMISTYALNIMLWYRGYHVWKIHDPITNSTDLSDKAIELLTDQLLSANYVVYTWDYREKLPAHYFALHNGRLICDSGKMGNEKDLPFSINNLHLLCPGAQHGIKMWKIEPTHLLPPSRRIYYNRRSRAAIRHRNHKRSHSMPPHRSTWRGYVGDSACSTLHGCIMSSGAVPRHPDLSILRPLLFGSTSTYQKSSSVSQVVSK